MNIDIWENASILEFIRSMEAKGDVIHSTNCGFCQSLNLFMQLNGLSEELLHVQWTIRSLTIYSKLMY